MSKKLSLVQFILKGILGGLKTGAGIELLRSLFGQPDDYGEGIGKSKIEKYFGGGLEVANLKGRVIFIALYMNKGKLENHSLFVNDLPVGVNKNKQQFLEWLDSQGVSYSTRNAGEDYTSIDIAGGASVGFDSESMITIQISE